MKKKTLGWYVVFVVFSAIIMLLVSTRTSPIYSLLLGDYAGNSASAAMLVGKYWLEGVIPYKDLYIIAGPVYLFMQMLGWLICGRSGIFLLQILSFTIFLIFLWKLLCLFVPEKKSGILTLLTCVIYISLCSGGNSAAEWCLPWTVLGCYYLTRGMMDNCISKKEIFITGIAMGIICMTKFICCGVLISTFLIELILTWKHNGRKEGLKMLQYFVIGMSIPVLGISLYFLAVGAIHDMISAVILLPVQMIKDGFVSWNLILHKMVKCILVMPGLLAAYCASRRAKKEIAFYLFGISIISAFSLFMGDNSWNCFIILIPLIAVSIAVLLSFGINKKRAFAIAGCFILSVGICIIPFKNYITYINDGIDEAAAEFFEDLQALYEEDATYQALMIDTDCSYYLASGTKPICKYFTDQTKIREYSSEANGTIESYFNGEIPINVMILTKHGWIIDNTDMFYLVQVYCKVGGSICIYLPSY